MKTVNNNQLELSDQDIPEINKAANISSLNLTSVEGFVFSQVDGVMTAAELKVISNLREEEFLQVIGKLVKTGAIKIKGKRASAPKSPAYQNKPASEAASFEDKVRNFYLNLESLNYYDLLGVSAKTNIEEIKKAFYRMTKEFHPDRFFRGGDVEVRNRLQSIFAKINDAYRTLIDSPKRREYDATLQKRTGKDQPIREIEVQPKKNPFMDTVLKAKRLYDGAIGEMKRKNFPAARQNLRLAMTLDPYNKSYPETLLKLDKLENSQRAQQYHTAALEHESEGRFKEASKLYREAMLLDPENETYYTRLAKIVFQQDNNPEAAKKLIQKAMELNAENPDQYLILGLIFRQKNQREAAIAQFEKGLKINPKHKELATELKRIKKGK